MMRLVMMVTLKRRMFSKDLKTGHTVVSENEPKLQRSEPFAQRDLPVLFIKVNIGMIIIFNYDDHQDHHPLSSYYVDYHENHHVVDGEASVLVLQVERLHVECSVQGPSVLHPDSKHNIYFYIIQ